MKKRLALWFSTRKPSADEHEHITSNGYWLAGIDDCHDVACGYNGGYGNLSESDARIELNKIGVSLAESYKILLTPLSKYRVEAVFGEFSLELLMEFATHKWGTEKHPWKAPDIFQLRPCFEKVDMEKVKMI
jgi:hypothetical protein